MTAYKKHTQILLLSILSLGFALIGSYMATGSFSKILMFNQVSFYLNYQELGFTRRALLGSLFYAFDSLNFTTHLVLSYASIFTAAAMFWGWIIYNQDEPPYDWRHYIVLLLSPALFLHFGYDLGRTDPISLILLIAGLIMIKNQYYFISGILACLAILIHELFFFAFLPVLVAFCYYQASEENKKNNLPSRIISIFFLAFITDIFLTILGGRSVDEATYYNFIEKHSINDGGAFVYFTKFTSIKYNIITSLLNFYGSLKLNLYHLTLLFLYLLIFLLYLLYNFNLRFDRRACLLQLSCFSPLFLLFISIDKGRWFSMVIFNLCVVSAFLYKKSDAHKGKISRYFLVAVIAFGLILGPMTISGFHFANRFNNVFKEPKRIFHSD